MPSFTLMTFFFEVENACDELARKGKTPSETLNLNWNVQRVRRPELVKDNLTLPSLESVKRSRRTHQNVARRGHRKGSFRGVQSAPDGKSVPLSLNSSISAHSKQV
jgi:hypothetical protein